MSTEADKMKIQTARIKPSTTATLATMLTQETAKLFENPEIEMEFQAWKKQRKETKREVQNMRTLRCES